VCVDCLQSYFSAVCYLAMRPPLGCMLILCHAIASLLAPKLRDGPDIRVNLHVRSRAVMSCHLDHNMYNMGRVGFVIGAKGVGCV
jgi:hypothetical protein